jgi:PAS domain S-box-containing protein
VSSDVAAENPDARLQRVALLPGATSVDGHTQAPAGPGGASVARSVRTARAQDVDRSIELEQSRYQHLFQLAPDAFVSTDMNGVIEEVNRAAELLFNATSARLRGRMLIRLLHPADRKHVHVTLKRLASGERIGLWRTWVLRRDDADPVPVEVKCAVHEHGTHRALLWSLRDIRERVRADRLELEAIERRRRDLEEYASRVQRLEKAKSDFLDLASHELRGPMTVVRGYVSMISEGTLGPVSEQVDGVMRIIRWKLEEMNRLISQMLDTARIDDDRLVLNAEVVDLRGVAGEAVQALLPQAASRQQELELVLPSSPVLAEVDRERVAVVMVNLVENALKYSPAATTVTCEVGVSGAQARVAVTDQGPGLDPQALDVLFSRFGRVVAPETSDVPGTGLGLYLAREIARLHGGDVVAECSGPPGSTFALLVPLALAGDQ